MTTGVMVLEALLGAPVKSSNEVFTVVAYDLNTNARLCEIPANNLTFDSRLDDSGSITFDVFLSNPNVRTIVEPMLEYEGIPFAVFVDRNGVLVWGGIAWTGNYTKSTGVLEVGGKEFLSYFDQRQATVDYSVLTYPGGIDPAILVGKVFTDVQATKVGAGATIGLKVSSPASKIPHIVPGYPITQQTTSSSIISDVLSSITPGYGGVDLQFVIAYDQNGNPTRTVNVVSPRAGRSAQNSGLFFDFSDCIDYTWPTDGTATGNVLTVLGSGSGSATPQATVLADVPLGGLGQMPRLDLVLTTTAQTQDTVNAMAQGAKNEYGEIVTTPTLTILTAGAQPLGTWIMGDDARLYIPPGDDRFPNGKDEYWRIVQQEVTVPDSGPATVVLTFNRPPVY